MSQENVEVAHRSFEAISRQDLDAFLALMDRDVVAVPRILAVEGGAPRGHDGIRTWWESIFGAFPDFDAEVISVRGVADLTISNVRVHGHGEGSATPFEDTAPDGATIGSSLEFVEAGEDVVVVMHERRA